MNRIGIFLAIFSLSMLSSCMLKEPGSPRWQVELNVPIADRQYSLSEIIADSTELDSIGQWVSGSGDSLVINFADSIQKMEITDELVFNGMNDNVQAFVGVRTLDSPGENSTEFQMENLNSLAGQTVTIPAFEFSQPAQTLASFDEYDWMYLAWGDVTITITNNTQVPLDTLDILVSNVNPFGTIVLNAVMEEMLYPGSSWTQIYPLPTEVEIDNELNVSINGHSPGESEPFLVHNDNHLLVKVEFTDLGARSAKAHIPNQTFDEDSIYSFQSEDSVSNTNIEEGRLSYTIRNGTGVINTVLFRLPDFYLDGQPFEYRDTLYQNQEVTVTDFSLNGYQYAREGMDNLTRGQLWVEILDSNYPPYPDPGSFVCIHQDSSVTAEFEISQLVFSQFEGYLANTELEVVVETTTFEDIPGGLNSLNAESALLFLQLWNYIGSEIEVDLTLNAYKGGNSAAIFNVPTIVLPAANAAEPGYYNEYISGLEEIINLLPDSIVHVGETRISGYVSLEMGQWVEGFYNIYTPFNFAIGQSTLEPETSTIDEGFDSQLDDAILTLRLENHIPLSGQAYILASFDSSEFGNPNSTKVDTFFQGPLVIPQLDAEGYVIESYYNETETHLNSEQIAMFAEANGDKPLYIKTFIVINSTNGEIVRARSTDYITVGAWTHLLLDINTGNE